MLMVTVRTAAPKRRLPWKYAPKESRAPYRASARLVHGVGACRIGAGRRLVGPYRAGSAGGQDLPLSRL